MKLSCKSLFIMLLLSQSLFARDHVIYSVDQEIPMGVEGEKLRKNYYINMGSGQGLKMGTILDVFRTISVINPYMNQTRINHKVLVGKLVVLHTEEQAAITRMLSFKSGEDTPLTEIAAFMIGDRVEVSTAEN